MPRTLFDEPSAMLTNEVGESPAEVLSLDILSRRGKTIRPKTLNQKRYVDAIDENTIVFGSRPGRYRQDLPRHGQGRSGVAGQAGLSDHLDQAGKSRPASDWGFLPGTLHEKIDPYLRPLHDALHDMMDPEAIPKLMQAGVIEVAPLAYNAWPDAQRRLHHLGRSAEHHGRADEDVPDPPRVRFQDRGHRRRDPGRSAGRGPVRVCARHPKSSPGSTIFISPLSTAATSYVIGWSLTSSTLTSVTNRIGPASWRSETGRSAALHMLIHRDGRLSDASTPTFPRKERRT